MKKIISGILVLLLPIFMIAQESKTDYKVLIKELQGEFKGKTKNGLAHGKGIAQGTDTYQGNFKKGLPNGKGKYTWNTGEVYDGKWLNGKRSGFGKYYFKDQDGVDSYFEGYWNNDIYLGKNIKDEEYKVLQSRNIERVSVRKRGEGNTVIVRYMRSGNNSLHIIKDLRYVYQSGSEITGSSISGIDNIEFPFKFKLNFTAPSKFRKATSVGEDHPTLDISRFAEIELLKPGNWEVTVTL